MQYLNKTLSLLLALFLLVGTLAACSNETYKKREELYSSDLEESVYVESVTLTNDDLKTDANNGNRLYAMAQKQEDGTWRYQIKYAVAPQNATDKSVSFIRGTIDDSLATIDESTGVVTFYREGSLMVTLSAKNSQVDASAALMIYAIDT